MTELPFDGDISRYFREDVRGEIEGDKKGELLATDFPHDRKWKRADYETALEGLQVELVKMHCGAKDPGQRIAIVVEGLKKWNDYTAAITETSPKTHTQASPWNVVRSADKPRAWVNAIRLVLNALDNDGKDESAIGDVDDKIVGGPEFIGG